MRGLVWWCACVWAWSVEWPLCAVVRCVVAVCVGGQAVSGEGERWVKNGRQDKALTANVCSVLFYIGFLCRHDFSLTALFAFLLNNVLIINQNG